MREVGGQLRPGISALFLMADEANVDAVIAALREHRGRVYQSSLSDNVVEELRRAVGERVHEPVERACTV